MGERSAQRLEGQAALCVGARGDQVAHRFGLGQIQFSIEKRTPGKFSRIRQARPLAKTAVQNPSHHMGPAVTGELHHVFPRVGPGRTKEARHRFVKNVILVFQEAMVKGMGGALLKRK